MPTKAKVELPVDVLYRLLHQLNLGEPHPLFAGGERYYSPRFKQESDAELRRALDTAGLSSPRGLDPEFTELLGVMQRGHVEFYGWLYDTEGPYAVLTAAAGRSAMLAERVGDKVSFEWIEANRVLDAFLFRLPAAQPARGETLSVRLADLAQTPRDGDFSLRRGAAVKPPEARRLETLVKAARKGGGKLYTARRDPHGKRHRAPDWVDVIDLAEGRWALYRTRGRGEPFVTAAPGTTQLVGTRLHELQATLH